MGQLGGRPMVKKSYSCNYCQRPTVIRRGYSLALMIVWIVLFIPAAPIYYYLCKRQCQACGGVDITEWPAGGGPEATGGGTGGGGTGGGGGAPVQ